MIRISDLSSLVKTFFKNIFFFRRLSCLSQKLLKRCLEFMPKELMITSFIPTKEKISLKAEDFLEELLPLLSGM